LEQEGFVRSEWGVTDKGRRARLYSLTKAGKKRLAEETKNWERLTEAVALVLRNA
jgi:DNA-binding PadR family transcriptional regulator